MDPQNGKQAAFNSIQCALNSVVEDALEILRFRDVAYYEPYERIWKTTLKKGDQIKTSFGMVEFQELSVVSGTAMCKHRSGMAFINGQLIITECGEFIVSESLMVVSDEDVHSNDESELLIKNCRCSKVDLRGSYVDDKMAKQIALPLRGNYLVKQLLLKGNRISDEGARQLGESLERNECLENLLLSYNQIGFEGSMAIAKAVSGNSTLKSLDLSYNNIGGKGLGFWLNEALSKNKTLQLLDLSHNHLGNDIGKDMFLALAPKSITDVQKSSLKSLLLADTGLSSPIAESLSNLVGTNQTITTLDISTNHFDMHGLKVLIKGFTNNKSLTSINFSHNKVNAELVGQLMDAMAKLPRLKVLNCHSCFEGSIAAQSVANLIASTQSLNELDISGCVFQCPGSTEMCKAIAQNSSLVEIELTSSGLGDESVIRTLADSLSVNRTLKRLNLGYNGITLRGCKWLTKAIEGGQGQCSLSDESLLLEGNSGYKDKKGVIVRGGCV